MKRRKIIGVILGIILLIMALPFIFYTHNLKAVGKNEDVIFIIDSGTSTVKVIENLKNNDLIRDIFATKMYVFLNKPLIQAGKYQLNKKMSVKEIFNILNSGKVINENIIITFKEGKRLTNYVDLICDNFNFDEKDVYNTLSDKTFLNELINEYWFITSDILDTGIYYTLEGYLYPDTYEFDKDATIKDIIIKMLNEMSNKLEPYKEKIENDDRSFHEILTMASIIELEATNNEDRKEVAGIFYNRIDGQMSLGSDVTTYYATRKDFNQELSENELLDCNNYNTRSTCLKGLPISPIASVNIESIDAAINYNNTDNYYFVADKNKKIYFSRTNDEHNKTIATLKSSDLWYNY